MRVVRLAFVGAWELRAFRPTFDLRLLRNRQLRVALAVVSFYATGMLESTFLLTFYLKGALRLSPLEAGLAPLPIAVPQLVLAPLGGALADRLGPARPVILGFAFLILGAVLLSRLGARLDLVAVVVPLLCVSAGNGFAWPALAKAMVSSAPRNGPGWPRACSSPCTAWGWASPSPSLWWSPRPACHLRWRFGSSSGRVGC